MGAAVRKVVFQPPPLPRHLDGTEDEYLWLKTARKETIVARHLDYGYDLTVLFSHGNAEDLVACVQYFEEVFCREIRVNAFLYEYSGYSHSTGKPSEANLYADVEAAYEYLTGTLGLKPEQIILYGRSLGSGPTCHLASKYDVRFRGIILQSPILSCYRVVVNSPVTLPTDLFSNVDKVEKIRSPILVIHGQQDSIVPFSHGEELFARCPSAVDYLWLPDADHNNIEKIAGKRLFASIRRFVHDISERFDEQDIRRQAVKLKGSPSQRISL